MNVRTFERSNVRTFGRTSTYRRRRKKWGVRGGVVPPVACYLLLCFSLFLHNNCFSYRVLVVVKKGFRIVQWGVPADSRRPKFRTFLSCVLGPEPGQNRSRTGSGTGSKPDARDYLSTPCHATIHDLQIVYGRGPIFPRPLPYKIFKSHMVALHMLAPAGIPDPGQRTEDRGQRTEDRGQRTEDS